MGTTRKFQMCTMALLLGLMPGMAAAQNRDAAVDQQPPIQARPGGPEISPRTATGLKRASRASAMARHSAPTGQMRGVNAGVSVSDISTDALFPRICKGM